MSLTRGTSLPSRDIPTSQTAVAHCSNTNCPVRDQYLAGTITVVPTAPLKCARCKSAYYCDQACQRAHWRAHKQFCRAWSETSAFGGDVPVSDVKVKMLELIQLLRGMPEYTEHMWREYRHYKPQCDRGFMEVSFDNFQELFTAIDLIKTFPVYERTSFEAMPGAPGSAMEIPGQGIVMIPQPIELRRIPEHKKLGFAHAVDHKTCFSLNDARPNLQLALYHTQGPSPKLFVLSVHVRLKNDYHTHMHDFIYKNLSYEE